MEAVGSSRLAQSLTWQAATRSELRVATALVEGEEPDGVYGLGDARVVDAFFCWLDDLGVLDDIRSLPMVGVKREGLPPELYVLVYFLRCIARIPSQASLPDLLFGDTALMLRLGFNAHQLEPGATRRGDVRRGGARQNIPVDPEAGLPLAVAFGTAEMDERPFVAGLLRRAREVLGTRGTLDTLVIDRGFMSGPGLWEIDAAGIRFIIPGRHDMEVYKEARRTAISDDSDQALYEKSRTRSRKVRGEPGTPLHTISETMTVVGVAGVSFPTYAPASNQGSRGHRDTINAVVLRRGWADEPRVGDPRLRFAYERGGPAALRGLRRLRQAEPHREPGPSGAEAGLVPGAPRSAHRQGGGVARAVRSSLVRPDRRIPPVDRRSGAPGPSWEADNARGLPPDCVCR